MIVKPLYYIPIFLQKVGFIVFYILHKLFVSVEVRGRENLIGLDKPIILASNHTSELDVTTIPLVLGFLSKFYPIYYVSMPKEKFTNFGWRNYLYGGIFFNVLGGYSIHSGFHDYETSLETFIDLLENKQTIFIFPEGKRTDDGKVGKARGGLGFMVYETGATVVPIAINTFHNMSSWEYFFKLRKVTITILKPIPAEELAVVDEPGVEEYRAASKAVMDRISQVL